MSLTADQMKTMMEMLAGAIKSAVVDAVQTQPAGASSSETSTVRAPAFSMSEYRQEDGGTVSDYFTRFNWALELSKVPIGEHASYARVHMGTQLNTALKILISPKTPDSLNYKEIKDTLSKHFDGQKNKYAESVRFRQLRQEPGESIANFTLRLKQGATFCDYSSFLDRMLIEQLLMGLESSTVCDELIAKKPETFAEAYELAFARELTHTTTKEVNAVEPTHTLEQTCKLGFGPVKKKKSVDNTKPSSESSPRNGKCYGCNGDHLRRNCRFKNAKCFACGKVGHIAKVCLARTRQVKSDEEDEDEEHAGAVRIVNRLKHDRIHDRKMILVNIDGKALEMELDTGAPCSIISRKSLLNIKPNCKLLKSGRKFASYTGHEINCIGRAVVNATLGKTSKVLNLYVVEDDLDTLCGREWIAHWAHEINFANLFSQADRDRNGKSEQIFDLGKLNNISSEKKELTPLQNSRLQQTIEKFKDVFGRTAGKLKGPPVGVHMKKDARPVFARPRDVPVALRELYAKEIDAKIAAGFYRKVEFSEWASTTHVVTKKNGAIRVTGNYKPTVNPQMIIDEHPIPKAEDLFAKMKGAKIFAHLDVTDAFAFGN